MIFHILILLKGDLINMEHWRVFENDNGTIEFADMEQWNESLNHIENNLNKLESKIKTKILSNIIDELIKLYNEIQEKIKYLFVKQDNIDKINNLINVTYKLTCKYYRKRKDKKRKELFEKIKELSYIIVVTSGIHFQIEYFLHYISNKHDSSCSKDIEDKIKNLNLAIINSENNYKDDEFSCIIKKWIYIVKYIKDNNLCEYTFISKIPKE